jgi:hypothetical protein
MEVNVNISDSLVEWELIFAQKLHLRWRALIISASSACLVHLRMLQSALLRENAGAVQAIVQITNGVCSGLTRKKPPS